MSASGPLLPAEDRRVERNLRKKLWRRARARARRRMWVVFLAFCCASGMAVFLGSEEPPLVSRVEAPDLGSVPVPPVVGGGLEARLSQIASAYPGEYGVAVFDARSGRTAEVGAGRKFEAASLAKLPAMLALYKEAADGELDLDEDIAVEAGDMTAEGSGVLHTYPAGHRMTLRECAEFLVKESDNTAWLMLERRLGKERISAELDALGLDSSDYEARATTPKDTLIILRAIADPEYTSPALSEEMLDMMTGTAYEGRLPEPLPEDVRVAHKVGTLGDTYSDAGIIFDEDSDDPGGAYYIVVISGGAGEPAAKEAIRRMSLAAHEDLRPDYSE